MQALISYWKTKLENNSWLMSAVDKNMVEQTIKSLKQFDKLRNLSRVQREAEIVKTVKQLDQLEKESKQDSRI